MNPITERKLDKKKKVSMRDLQMISLQRKIDFIFALDENFSRTDEEQASLIGITIMGGEQLFVRPVMVSDNPSDPQSVVSLKLEVIKLSK